MIQGGFFYEKDVKDLGPDEHHLPITRRLMEDGVNHLVLRRPLAINGPVRLFQGQRDTEVPWQTALKIAAHLQGDDVAVTLIKEADHRLSRAQDLALIWRSIEAMMES